MSSNLLSLAVLFLSLSFINSAQSQFFNSIDIIGGMRIDFDKFHGDQSTEYKTLIPKINYLGTNYLSINLNSEREKNVFGLGLELTYFEKGSDVTIIQSSESTAFREKFQSQLIFHYGKYLKVSEKYKLQLSPIIGMSYLFEKHYSVVSYLFPVTTNNFTIGLGLKIQNHFQISDRIGILLGSRFFLLDNTLGYDRTENPSLPLRTQRQGGFSIDLIREELLVQLGINFKI